MKDMGIYHHMNTPRWPQANGEVERQNRSLEKRLKIAHADGKNWKSELLTYVTAYRSVPHTVTGKSPAEIFFGRRVRTKLPELIHEFVDHELRDRDSEEKGKRNQYANQKRCAKESCNPVIQFCSGGKIQAKYKLHSYQFPIL
jgi:hypothetical protein